MQEGASNDIKNAVEVLARIRQAYKQVIIGQEEAFESIIVTLLSRGHLLIEGVPGLAKTMATHTIAASLGANFARIQCTPDMLPADIIGTQIYNPAQHTFITQLGPINHQFVLVDEINRTSAKTQSALLEAMQERQVSLGGRTYPLPPGFIVMATQNPIEQEGTYLLPEAQLDRFLFKHVISYPTLDEEIQVMKTHDIATSTPDIQPQASIDDLLRITELVRQVQVDDKVLKYIASVVAATRNPEAFNLNDIKPYLEFGASPRASLALVAAGRAAALMDQSSYATPDHIKPFLQRVLRHRVGLTYQAEAEAVTADSIIKHIGDSIIVP